MDPHFASAGPTAVETLEVDRQIATLPAVRRRIEIETRLDERGVGVETRVEQRGMEERRRLRELLGHDDARENLVFAAQQRFDASKRGAVFQSQTSQRPVIIVSGDRCRASLLDLAQVNRIEPLLDWGRRVFLSQANDVGAPSLLHFGVDARQPAFGRRPVNRGQNRLHDALA